MPLRLVDYVRRVQSLVHDFTESAWSRREMLERINDARRDVARDCQCVRSLVDGVQLMPFHERYHYDGAVVGARITDPGAGYTSSVVPVMFGPPSPGGVQAEGFAQVQNLGSDGHLVNIVGPGPEPGMGSVPPLSPGLAPWLHERPGPNTIRAVFMTQWGRAYTQVPTIIIGPPDDPAGRQATAEAIVLFNVFNVLSISPLWNTLRYTMSYAPFSRYQNWGRALQAQGFTSRPGMWTIDQAVDQLVYMQPTPDQVYFSEWRVVGHPHPLVGLNDLDLEITEPWTDAVQFKAASWLLMKHQNFGQAEYYERKYDAYVPRIVAGAGGVRIPNPYSKSMYEKMRRM